MDSITILIVSMLIGLLLFTLIAVWYVMPYLSKQPRIQAFTPLLILHGFRYIGLAFLIPGVVAEQLPRAFAYPAAYGDLIAALLAIAALAALRIRWWIAIPAIWIFNVVGFIDLLNAIYQGLIHASPALLQAAFFIPVLIVPALLVTHVMIFRLLFTKGW